MVVLPKENPVLANLNSYYVQIERLIEHFQGEVGCGGLHFSSLSSEGIVFFDKDELLNGVFTQKKKELIGLEAVDSLITSAETTNYSLSIYALRSEDIYFWSTIPGAKKIYQDLTTEFTDLEGLINKMTSEELTGFVDVTISGNRGGGLIFFNHGQISGGSYSWGKGESLRSEEDQKQLIQLTKEHGGSFHVSRISIEESNNIVTNDIYIEAEEFSEGPSIRIITAMEELIVIFERTVKSSKNFDSDFTTLLNRKFVEKADQYPFLDPFAAEFKYASEKIYFDGDTTDEELTKGVVESIIELANELEALKQLKKNLVTWMKKYNEEVNTYSIAI